MPTPSLPKPDFSLLEAFWKEPVRRVVLENGVTVLVRADSSAPVASVQVWVKTGSIHEMDMLGAGVSHFVEHMLFKGTERRLGREISRTVQEHGGYINAYTTFDRTVYYIDLPAEHLGVAVDLLGDTVLHSTFPAEEVTKERDVILREIDMGRDDPDHRLSQALFETAFKVHPYRYPIIGYKDVFASLSREDLVRYYRSRYVPNNLVVVIAGDVDPDEAVARVQDAFGKSERVRLAPSVVADEPAQLAARANHRYEDVEVTRAGLAWPLPGITHPDAPALDMLAGILGGGDSSRLWQTVREKRGLVHTIDAHSWTPGSAGLFYISFMCDAGKREDAEEEIHRVIAKAIQHGFTPQEIAKAQRQMIVSEINSRKTVSGQAGRLGVAEVVAGDQGFARTYFDRLRSLNGRELQRVLKLYVRPGTLTAISTNPLSLRKAEAPASKAAHGLHPFTEYTLANGVRVLLQENHSLPNVHFRVLCAGGGALEEPGKRGATALLSTLLTKDTRKRNAAQVAQFVEEVGGAFYPISGNNSFGLAAEALPKDIERALEVIQEGLLRPAFKEATVATERAAQLADLQQDKDDVVSFARKRLRALYFGGHPLAIEPSGLIETVSSLSANDLRALWKQTVVASNLVVAVSGAFSTKALLPLLKTCLKSVPKGTIAHSAHAHPGAATAEDLVERQPREQAVVMQAFPGPGIKDADFYVGEVADELFSGMSSRLFERVREEKAMAYFVRSSRITGMDTGMFSFLAGTSPAQAADVIAEIDAEVDRVQRGGVTPEELRRCQTRLKAGRKMGLQTNAARAMQAALNALYGFPAEEWLRYDAQIDAVTLAEIQTFARKYFQRSLRTQLVVQP